MLKLKSAEDKHCDDLALRAELNDAWDKERRALVSAHDEVVSGLEEALSSNDASGKAALQAVERERIRLEVELDSEKNERQSQVNALNAQHSDVMRQLQGSRRQH